MIKKLILSIAYVFTSVFLVANISLGVNILYLAICGADRIGIGMLPLVLFGLIYLLMFVGLPVVVVIDLYKRLRVAKQQGKGNEIKL